MRVRNPRVAHDPVLQRWWGRVIVSEQPGLTVRQFEAATKIDYEPLFPRCECRTLVSTSGQPALDIGRVEPLQAGSRVLDS